MESSNYLPTPSTKVAGGRARVSLRQSTTARKLSLNKPSVNDEIAPIARVDDKKQKRHKMVLRRNPPKTRTSDGNNESIKSTDHVYMCPECDRKFTDTKKLKSHRRIGHKVLTESLLKTPSPRQPGREDVPSTREQDRPPSHFQLPGPSPLEAGNPMPESVLRLLQDCEKYPPGKEVEELGSLTTTPPPSFESSAGPSSDTRSNDSVSDELMPPPVTPSHHQRRVQFQTPRRTISEDKAARGVASVVRPPPTPRGISTVCPVCDLILPNMGSFRNHLEIHEGKRPFMCPECYRGYETEIQLLEHFSRHSNEPTFACGGCGKKYKTSRGLHNHRILKGCSTPAPGQ